MPPVAVAHGRRVSRGRANPTGGEARTPATNPTYLVLGRRSASPAARVRRARERLYRAGRGRVAWGNTV